VVAVWPIYQECSAVVTDGSRDPESMSDESVALSDSPQTWIRPV